jgi:hypothetical protein
VSDGEYRPRPHDHLVEPFLAGLPADERSGSQRVAGVHGVDARSVDAWSARGSRRSGDGERHRSDAVDRAAAPNPLQRGVVPGWWIGVTVGALALALAWAALS